MIIFWNLTHISLASFLWDISKQNSPGCNAAKRGVPSGAILFTDINKNEKITPVSPENESRLSQMIRMGKSIRNRWVKALYLSEQSRMR